MVLGVHASKRFDAVQNESVEGVFEEAPDDQSAAHEQRDSKIFTARPEPYKRPRSDNNPEDVEQRIDNVPCRAELQQNKFHWPYLTAVSARFQLTQPASACARFKKERHLRAPR